MNFVFYVFLPNYKTKTLLLQLNPNPNIKYTEGIYKMSFFSLSDNGMLQIFSFFY